MTQMMIEQLTQEEYSNLLAYGEPVSTDTVVAGIATNIATNNDNDSQEREWISTLESTTFPGLTFGYHEPVRIATLTCMSTAV